MIFNWKNKKNCKLEIFKESTIFYNPQMQCIVEKLKSLRRKQMEDVKFQCNPLAPLILFKRKGNIRAPPPPLNFLPKRPQAVWVPNRGCSFKNNFCWDLMQYFPDSAVLKKMFNECLLQRGQCKVKCWKNGTYLYIQIQLSQGRKTQLK